MKTHATYQYRGYCTRGGHRRLDAALREFATLYNAALQETARRPPDGREVDLLLRPDQIDHRGPPRASRVTCHERAGGPRGPQTGRQGVSGVLGRARSPASTGSSRGPDSTPSSWPRPNQRWSNALPMATGPTSGSGGLPTVTLRTKRPLPDDTPKNLLITRRPTGIVVSLTFEVEKRSLPASESAVGIDMGVSKRLTLSDGGTC